MPLHVADAPHRLDLRLASAKLVEVPELALLQQVLAAAVAGELVAHKAEEVRGWASPSQHTLTGIWYLLALGGETHVPQLTMMLPTLSVKPWENRLGTSSSMISILRPLNSSTSYRHILCFSGS